MIQISFTEPDTEEWQAWKTKAEEAHEALIEKARNGEELKIHPNLYKEQRAAIFGAFHGKCAYCETRYIVDQTGDVEHFRPKGAVCDIQDQKITYHKGYYWRAYDWQNLLPSCSKCNRLSVKDDGKREGKGIRFPLKVEANRAFYPGDEVNEDPFFIHPIFEDPAKHLRFDEETGLLYSRTVRGKVCIELLGLNREGLPEKRRNAYDLALYQGDQALKNFRDRKMKDFYKNRDKLTAILRGEQEYSFAAQKAANTFFNEMKTLNKLLFP